MEKNHNEDAVFGRDTSDRHDPTQPPGSAGSRPISGTELRRRLITPESLAESAQQPTPRGFLRRLLHR
jgi:hypothetical protein